MEIIDKVALTGNCQGRNILFFLDLMDDGNYEVKKAAYFSGSESMSIHSMLSLKNVVYMADSINNKIYKYDCDSGTFDETNVGRDPRHMCINNDNMYVANFESDNISIIDLNTFSLAGSIPSGIKPHDVKLSGSNFIYTSCYEENIIIEYNLLSGDKNYIDTDGKPMHLFLKNDVIIVMTYYVNGNISTKINFININNKNINNAIKIVGLSSDIDYDSEKGLLYIINIEDKCLYIVDVNKMNIMKKIFLGGYPEGLCFGNENIYITNSKKNQITVIEKETLSVINSIDLEFSPNLIKILHDC